MTISSRMPLEFIAVVGVLVVTVAIIEVPRSNMLPPEVSALDAQSWRVPPVARTSATLLPREAAAGLGTEQVTLDEPTPPAADAAQEIDRRRIERLQASIDRKCQWLAQRRADLAAAELQFLHAKASMGPKERALLASLAMPRETLREILDRRKLLASDKEAVEAGTRAMNYSRYRIKELARLVARRRVKINRMQDHLGLLNRGLARPVSLAD
jgi:hypothetical protein